MSKHFTYPNNPLDWPASPKDFAETVPDVPYMGIYTQELTQRYIPGTRYTTWDGRVFKYGKCGATLESAKYFVYNYSQLVAEVSDPDAELDAAAAGDTRLSLTVVAAEIGSGRNGIIAEDELAGGYISIYSSTTGYRPQRMIVGNDALANDGVKLIVYIDAPLEVLTTGSANTEICANPYIDLRRDAGGYVAAMGAPCIKATTGYFFWIQSWGICRITPTADATHGYGNNQCQFFSDNYGLYQQPAAYDAAKINLQRVGFRTERTGGVSGDAAPFVMLQISI